MNQIILIGRTTKDIELKQSNGGKSYCRFNLAVNRMDKTSDFINCTAFGKTAELLEKYVKKGNKLGIVGRLQQNNFEKDGEKRSTYTVAVESMEFLESKGATPAGNTSNTDVVDDDEFPF